MGAGADTNDSSLETIGEEAFYNARLNYVNESLILPDSIIEIGNNAFATDSSRVNLQKILFMGTRSQLNNLGTNWYPSYTSVEAYINE